MWCVGLKNRTEVLNREENIWEQAHLGLQHSEIQVEVQTGVGTLFKFLDILETEGGLHTFHLKVSGLMLKLGWGHQTKFKYVREAGGGHCTFQLRVSGQMFKLGWGHRTRFFSIIQPRVGTQLSWESKMEPSVAIWTSLSTYIPQKFLIKLFVSKK